MNILRESVVSWGEEKVKTINIFTGRTGSCSQWWKAKLDRRVGWGMRQVFGDQSQPGMAERDLNWSGLEMAHWLTVPPWCRVQILTELVSKFLKLQRTINNPIIETFSSSCIPVVKSRWKKKWPAEPNSQPPVEKSEIKKCSLVLRLEDKDKEECWGELMLRQRIRISKWNSVSLTDWSPPMRPRGGIHITHYNNSQSVSPAWASYSSQILH